MSIVKKIFFLSLLILFMSLLFWGVYNWSFSKPKPTAEQPKTDISTSAPSAASPKISAASDEVTISPTLTSDGIGIKYYSPGTGKIYQMDLNGKGKTSLSSDSFLGTNDIIWSPDATRAILKSSLPDGSTRFNYYDLASKKITPIKPNVDEIAWQSNSSRIFYKYYDTATKARTLNVADPDGSNWTKLADLDYRNVSIAQIPRSGMVSFWNRPDAFSQTNFQSIPVVSGEKKTIYTVKFGADYLWNTDGTYVLLSSTDVRGGSKIQLAIMNYNGGEYRDLDVPTFASKCVWSKDNKTVYYALPGGIPPSAILPNEYQDGKFNTTDTFWKVNTKTGEKTRIIDTDKIGGQYDATDLFLNSDESRLYFVNKVDGKLYKLDL